MRQYLDLLQRILDEGVDRGDRTGTGTRAVFGHQMRFDLADGFPLLTTKKLHIKSIIYELLWFISGSTDNKILKAQNVKIWNDNASREYLDSIGFTNREEDDLGPVYGHQWRHFNAKYNTCDDDYTNHGVDQLQYIIDCLCDPKQRYSRRLVMSAWNPCQLPEMALPPCHILCQFNVSGENKLSCHLYQRSGDIGLGVPFNIASYSMLTYIIAKHCDLVPYEFIYSLGNAHIYDDHIDGLKELITRTPFEFPSFEVKNKHDNIDNYNIDDFILNNYKYHNTINLNMRK